MMVRLRNVSSGLVMVGERYLFPGESRLVDGETAAAVLASSPGVVVASHPDHSGSLLELSDDKPLLSSEEPSPPAPLPKSGEGGEEPHPSPPQIGEGADVSLSDDLTVIKGIGPRTAEVLAGLGIDSFVSLAGADVGRLVTAKVGNAKLIEGWIVQAQDLAAEEG